MTEAHELPHVVLPFVQGIPDREEEPAVARFAGAFLLPDESLKPAFGAHRNPSSPALVRNGPCPELRIAPPMADYSISVGLWVTNTPWANDLNRLASGEC